MAIIRNHPILTGERDTDLYIGACGFPPAALQPPVRVIESRVPQRGNHAYFLRRCACTHSGSCRFESATIITARPLHEKA